MLGAVVGRGSRDKDRLALDDGPHPLPQRPPRRQIDAAAERVLEEQLRVHEAAERRAPPRSRPADRRRGRPPPRRGRSTRTARVSGRRSRQAPRAALSEWQGRHLGAWGGLFLRCQRSPPDPGGHSARRGRAPQRGRRALGDRRVQAARARRSSVPRAAPRHRRTTGRTQTSSGPTGAHGRRATGRLRW